MSKFIRCFVLGCDVAAVGRLQFKCEILLLVELQALREHLFSGSGGAGKVAQNMVMDTKLKMGSKNSRDGLEAPLVVLEEFDGGPTSRMGDLVEEAKTQLGLGLPVALMGLMSYSLYLVSLAFVGRLGALRFAAAAMASSFTSVFGYAVLDGLSAGMDTFGGQAFGAGQQKLLGIVLQRGIFVLLMACLPIGTIYCCASQILLFFGQDPEIVELAAVYVMALLPGLFASAFLLPLQKFLEVQGVMIPLALSTCCVLLLSFPLNYLLIYVFNFGFVGGALAYCSSNLLNLAILVIYLQCESTGILEKAWPGWRLAAFRDWGEFLKLAVPAMLMNCFEWWFFEVLIVMAGLLPHPDISLSAMNISYQTAGSCYMLFLGLSTAASVRVSNELGAQRPGKAKSVVVVAVCISLLIAGIVSCLLIISRNEWALIFTTPDEVEVVALVSRLMPLIVMAQLALSLSATLSGVLRGSGQQLAGSIINGLTLWVVACPTSYYLAVHKQYGLEGLWLGLLTGVGLQAIMNFWLAWRTDWVDQAIKAFERVG